MGANITWDEDVKKREKEEEEKMKDIEEQKWFGEVIGSQWRAQVLCRGDRGFDRKGRSGVTHPRPIIETRTRAAWFFVANTPS